MTIARSRQISLQDTPYYHVRRAFLCGADAHSGQSYEQQAVMGSRQAGSVVRKVGVQKRKKRRRRAVSGSLYVKPDENG